MYFIFLTNYRGFSLNWKSNHFHLQILRKLYSIHLEIYSHQSPHLCWRNSIHGSSFSSSVRSMHHLSCLEPRQFQYCFSLSIDFHIFRSSYAFQLLIVSILLFTLQTVVIAFCPNNHEVHIYKLLEEKWEKIHVLQKVIQFVFLISFYLVIFSVDSFDLWSMHLMVSDFPWSGKCNEWLFY